MPPNFREFCVVLRHVNAVLPPARQEFIAIVSAENMVGAQIEAAHLAETLNGMVSVVSIRERDQSDPNCEQ